MYAFVNVRLLVMDFEFYFEYIWMNYLYVNFVFNINFTFNHRGQTSNNIQKYFGLRIFAENIGLL